MRPKKQSLSAAGSANWIPVSEIGAHFGIGIGVNVSNGGTLTYSIQHSFDDPQTTIDCTIARVTTVATVTFTSPHGKDVGDSIAVSGITEDNLLGTFAVASVPSTTTLTYPVADTGSAAESAKAVLFSVFEHDTLTGLTGNADGGYTLPPSAVRLTISAFTDGVAEANYRFLS